MVNIGDIAERIKKLRTSKGLTQEAFAESVETSRSILSQIEIGKLQPSIEILAMISSKYDVDYKFLIEGKKVTPNLTPNVTPIGEDMLISVSKSVSKEKSLQIVGEQPLLYGRQPAVITLDSAGKDNIALVESKAAASYLKHYMEPEYFKKLRTFSVPGLNHGVFRGFQVKGISMQPNFNDQDYVVGQFVDNYKNIREGYVHIVVTNEDIVIKRVLNRIEKRGKFVLISDNEDFDTYEVDVEDVKELWDFKCLISAKVPSRRHDFTRLISNLQADILELRDRLFKLDGKK